MHPKKSVFEPTQSIVFLGFLINSVTMTVNITNDKAEGIIQLCTRLVKRRETIREFAQIIGKFVATEPAVEYAPLLYKSRNI